MTEFSAKVKITEGKGTLCYQDFFRENLNEIRITCPAVYAHKYHRGCMFISCNGSIIKFRASTIYNTLAMFDASRGRGTKYFPFCLEMPLTICPKELQFRILNEDGEIVRDFEGYLLVKIYGRYKKNEFI